MVRTFILVVSLLLASNLVAEEVSRPAQSSLSQDAASAQFVPGNEDAEFRERESRRAKVRSTRDKTLEQLYKVKPKVKEDIAGAAGYAVFEAHQTNVVLLVTGKGEGLVFDNTSGKETFMKMARLGTGPGVGRKKFKQVLVFKSKGLLEQFIAIGADISASADALFKPSAEFGGVTLNGVASLNPALQIYQITERGILLQANWGGVGYLPDKELNETE